MCSLGDLKFVMENVYFPQSEHRNPDNNRFDTLCNCHRNDEFDNVLFLLNWLCHNSDKSDDFKLTKKMSDMISHKIVKSKIKGMSFYTICPKNKIRDTPENIKLMTDYCNDLFCKHGINFFNKVWYVIECGKHVDDSNLHIHLLADFKEFGSKNFRARVYSYWKKYFPDEKHDITYKIKTKSGKFNEGVQLKNCNTLVMIKDKITYMDNESKGSHENYRDLGLRFHHNFEV